MGRQLQSVIPWVDTCHPRPVSITAPTSNNPQKAFDFVACSKTSSMNAALVAGKQLLLYEDEDEDAAHDRGQLDHVGR
jgi:hypothetical protein